MSRFKAPQKARRDANEPAIVALLRVYGFSVEHMDHPADLLIGRNGQTWIAEVKSAKGKFTSLQSQFYDAWRGNVLILRSEADVVDFANEARGLGSVAKTGIIT